jgi:hypothetical protein
LSVSTASVLTATRDAAATAALLHKLAFDDEFRARLEESPRETLAEYRLDVPAELCLTLALPTKDQARAVLNAALAAGEVGHIDTRVFAWFC